MTAPQYVATRWDADSFSPGPGLPIVTVHGVLISGQGDLDAVRTAAGLLDIELRIQDGPFGPDSSESPGDYLPFVRYDMEQALTADQIALVLATLGLAYLTVEDF